MSKWITYNTALVLISYIHLCMIAQHNIFNLAFVAARNYVIAYSMDYVTQNSRKSSTTYKKMNAANSDSIDGHRWSQTLVNMLQISALEVATIHLCTKHTTPAPRTIQTSLLMFIPVSFVFEVIYDGLHYCIHRFMHNQRLLAWHKQHHSHSHVTAMLTFDQSLLDLVMSNTIPFITSHALITLVHSLSVFDVTLMLSYKVFVEVAGHTGKDSFPSSSFPQFVWLPRWLGIELYAEDHHMHHSHGCSNFSKRFTLWDRVGGTYRPSRRRGDEKVA